MIKLRCKSLVSKREVSRQVSTKLLIISQTHRIYCAVDSKPSLRVFKWHFTMGNTRGYMRLLTVVVCCGRQVTIV
nr:MAG TPA: hypothetical protein [Caudoviricetes sp.]